MSAHEWRTLDVAEHFEPDSYLSVDVNSEDQMGHVEVRQCAVCNTIRFDPGGDASFENETIVYAVWGQLTEREPNCASVATRATTG